MRSFLARGFNRADRDGLLAGAQMDGPDGEAGVAELHAQCFEATDTRHPCDKRER